MCVCRIGTYECSCPGRSEEGVRTAKTGIQGEFCDQDLLPMGALKKIKLLCKTE